jgi:RimJ/RimL family protein N-acetyltransferase
VRTIVYDKERIGEWVAEKVGQKNPWGHFQAMGVEKDGELIAGVVYEGFTEGGRCSMHCAGVGKRWMSRDFLWMCFAYPFYQLDLKIIINPVSSDNVESMLFTEHCGFTKECVIKDGYGDADLVIYSLHRDNCKWLGVKHGIT